jgi:ferredoxin
MIVCIDRTKCSGHGRCYSVAPEVFESDDEGFGVVRGAELPEALVPAAERAAANCPERAIEVTS